MPTVSPDCVSVGADLGAEAFEAFLAATFLAMMREDWCEVKAVDYSASAAPVEPTAS
jgi:hypothetical protein